MFWFRFTSIRPTSTFTPPHSITRSAIGFLLGLAALSLGRPATVNAQAVSTAEVSGRVVAHDTAAGTEPSAIAGVTIFLDKSTDPAARTDANGMYSIAGVVPGRHVIQTRRAGYNPAGKVLDIQAGATIRLDFALSPAKTSLSAVTIIGTRTDLDETRASAMAVPGGVAVITPAEISDTRQANLKDVLKFTPGVYIQPRFGAAEESQISVRGSGLRNNYHARGINLLVNGMPYRNADGFTDFESLELLTTEAIEVYKGANALRYGGSTLGGAINLDTKTGYTAAPISLFGEAGGFGFQKEQVSSGAVRGPFDYYASYAHTGLDGFRDWSDQKRDRVNLHMGLKLSGTTDARVFYFFAHVQEHLPGSVDQATLDTAPQSPDPTNVVDRWGRKYDLHHIGFQVRSQLSPTQRLEISPYLQYRDIDHPIYQVINQQSKDWGAEVRYENTARLGAFANRLTLGFQPALEAMHNRQFVNVAGKHGALSRDEQDGASTLGLYAEDALSLTPRFSAIVGVRFDRATRTVDDHFLSDGDQSDSRTYEPVTPRLGLLYQMEGGGQVFANASRTVEPPLLLELSSFGNTGGFIDLKAQEAWQYEVGGRAQRFGFAWDLSLYDIELRNEILNLNVQPFPGAPYTVPTYRNAPTSRHSGVELGVAYQLPGGVFVTGDGHNGDALDHITTRLAYTYGRFVYVDDPTYAGNDIPGAPRHYVTVEIKYTHPSGFSLAPTIEWVPQAYYVNSVNTVKNAAWSNLGFRADWAFESAGMTAFVSGQNLVDRRFSQSVQVDNDAGRFFEPADGRSFYAGLRWSR